MELKKLIFEVNQIKKQDLPGLNILMISNIKLEPYFELYLIKEFSQEGIVT